MRVITVSGYLSARHHTYVATPRGCHTAHMFVDGMCVGCDAAACMYRFCPQNTVEERILELQQRKREVVAAALNEEGRGDASQTGTRLTMEDLKYLFGVR